MVYRAHELDFINDQRYRSLQIQMSKWSRSEPGTFQPATGQLVNHLVEVNGGMEKVAADLGVNRKHLGSVTSWSHLRAV